MDVFEVERRVKRLISEYMQEGSTDSQVISRLHLSLSTVEKDTLLEGVYRRYLGELRQYNRLQSTTEEILFPKANPKVVDASGQRDDLVVRTEIKKALADLANSRFNSLAEHAVALQRLCRISLNIDQNTELVVGDMTIVELSKAREYYRKMQQRLQPRIEGVEAMMRFMDRVQKGGTFRENIDYVNQHGADVDDAIVTDLLVASEELS